MKHATKGPLHARDLEGVLGPVRFETHILRLDDVIQQHIRIVLFACNGNKQEAPGCSASAVLRSIACSMMNPTRLRNQYKLKVSRGWDSE